MKNEKRIRHYMPPVEISDLVVDGVRASIREISTREMLIAWIDGVSLPSAR
jgi:hypothetical protein